MRLNNVSQLAGFAKRDDLKFFLRRVCGIDYVHLPDLAPTKEMLADYRTSPRRNAHTARNAWAGTPTSGNSST